MITHKIDFENKHLISIEDSHTSGQFFNEYSFKIQSETKNKEETKKRLIQNINRVQKVLEKYKIEIENL